MYRISSQKFSAASPADTWGNVPPQYSCKKASLPNSLADTGLPQYMALGRECDMNIMLGDGLSGKRP